MPGSSFAADLPHRCANLLDKLVLDLEFLERHFPLPDVFRDFVFELEDVVAPQTQGDAAELACEARIAVSERSRHDPKIEWLVEAEHEHEVLCPVLVSQGFDGFLFRKTCGAGSRSDEAGRRFVNDFGAGCFDAVAHGETGDVVAFAENGHFLTLEHAYSPDWLRV
jgi:hypothetical protein